MRRNIGYLPTEDHGVIGDLHTAALDGIDGTTDWLCLPRFDAPNVFAAILDDEKGGHLKLAPGLRPQPTTLPSCGEPAGTTGRGSEKETRHD